jgi:hypothetical protein
MIYRYKQNIWQKFDKACPPCMLTKWVAAIPTELARAIVRMQAQCQTEVLFECLAHKTRILTQTIKATKITETTALQNKSHLRFADPVTYLLSHFTMAKLNQR